jgi:membrane-associated phospholipid phosphatase
MATEENDGSSSSTSYGLAEGATIDRRRLNIGLSDSPLSGDGLMMNDVVAAQGPYLWSTRFFELVISIAYLVVVLVASYALPLEANQRPIPYQYLDNSGDYARNQMFNESFEGETVSIVALVILSLCLPLAIQLALSTCSDRKRNDLHATACVYTVAMATTTLATESTKLYVGYLRPIFYDQCEPDDEYQECTGDETDDIRKSFPSGHSSMAFCGLTLLTLFVHARFGVASQRYYQRAVGAGSGEGQQWVRETIQVGIGWSRFMSLLAVLPMGLALFIAASRVVDNKHFPADVVAGSLLGASISVHIHGLWFD